MRTLKMSWSLLEGRLVCQWTEAEEPEKYNVVLMTVNWWCRHRRAWNGFDGQSLRRLVTMLERI